MAGIFIVYAFAIGAIFYKKRQLSIILFSLGLILTLLMFWHHATDILKINL